MKVYLAASSADIDRARQWRDKLVAAGIEVVSTWIENVERVGEANPYDASIEERAAWSSKCLREAKHADCLWLLYPSMSTLSASGALVEFGYVLGSWGAAFATPDRRVGLNGVRDRVVISGDTRRSIFPALGREFQSSRLAHPSHADEEAFAAIVEMARSAA